MLIKVDPIYDYANPQLYHYMIPNFALRYNERDPLKLLKFSEKQ